MKIEITLGVEKYHIAVEQSSYTVEKLTGNLDKKGNEVTQIMGYFSSLDVAIKRITQATLAEKEETVTLKEYVEEFKSVLNSITEQLP